MDLFGRAKKAMGGFSAPPPPKPHFFQVRCPDGHLIEGRRNEAYQALRCPDCGEGVFVLPASPLPEPKLPANRAPRKAKPVDDLDEPIPLSDPEAFTPEENAEEIDQVEWVDEEESTEDLVEARTDVTPPAPDPDPAAPVAEFDPDLHLDDPAPTTPAAAKPKTRPKANGPASTTPKPAPRPHRPPFTETLRRYRHAIVAVLVVGAVGAAVFNRLWRLKVAELPKVYERGKTEGLAALERGDFAAAKELLRAAADAIKVLGGKSDDPEVDAVIHGAAEAAIFADMARLSLDELVEKRARSKSGEEWDREFSTYHEGQAVVFQVNVTATPDAPNSPGGYEIDYRIGFGGGPTPAGRGRIDLKGFRLVEDGRPKKGDRLTFGARLAGVDFDVERNEYLVRLQPDSGVLLRSSGALSVLQVGVPHPGDREDEK